MQGRGGQQGRARVAGPVTWLFCVSVPLPPSFVREAKLVAGQPLCGAVCGHAGSVCGQHTHASAHPHTHVTRGPREQGTLVEGLPGCREPLPSHLQEEGGGLSTAGRAGTGPRRGLVGVPSLPGKRPVPFLPRPAVPHVCCLQTLGQHVMRHLVHDKWPWCLATPPVGSPSPGMQALSDLVAFAV